VTRFTVDPASIEELVNSLSDIHAELQGLHGTATGYEGLLGGPDLEGEVEGFCIHWNYGISQLADHMTQVVQHLVAAAKTYSKTEGSIKAAATPTGGGS
jgi:hypothetical protein